MTRASASGGPPIRRPIGKPERENPHGTDIDGKPPMLKENVQAFRAKGSAASSILSGNPGKVGTRTRSTSLKAWAMLSR